MGGADRTSDRVFPGLAVVMALVVVAGFSLQLAMGRSSFEAPLLVHAHAVVFMGWVVIFLVQNLLIATGQLRWHRPLGWLAAAWLAPMLIPWAWEATTLVTLAFPLIGMIIDLAKTRRIHPAWFWGLGVQIAMIAAIEALTWSPLGLQLYQTVTAGSPGAAVSPLAFPTPPGPPPGV